MITSDYTWKKEHNCCCIYHHPFTSIRFLRYVVNIIMSTETNSKTKTSLDTAAGGTSILSKSLKLPCGFIIPNRLCKSAMTESLAG